MYEAYSAPLPDEAAYWERLGIEPPRSKADLTLELLDRMIFAHQSRISFENLDVHDFHRPISIEIPDVFQKIIVQGRGGFCFELGALFGQLLRAAGFQAVPCIGRNVRGKDFYPPLMHRAELVDVGGTRYYCDVGYGGPMAACALPLVDGAERTSCGQTFRITQMDDVWWTVSYLSARTGTTAPIVHFMNANTVPVDFEPLSYYCATHPDSVFVLERIVNRRTEDGSLNIRNNVFTRISAEGRETREITSVPELNATLKQQFGLEVEVQKLAPFLGLE